MSMSLRTTGFLRPGQVQDMSSKVKEAIEEMIEESYLLGLSEHEIRQDFKRFIDACFAVIQENVKDRAVVSELSESLAHEQTVLIAGRAEGGPGEVPVGDVEEPAEEGRAASSKELSERVARRKRSILRAIAEHDPSLVRLIDAHRFQSDGEEPPRDRAAFRPLRWPASGSIDGALLRDRFLRLGYAATIALIILLVWLGLMQD